MISYFPNFPKIWNLTQMDLSSASNFYRKILLLRNDIQPAPAVYKYIYIYKYIYMYIYIYYSVMPIKHVQCSIQISVYVAGLIQ